MGKTILNEKDRVLSLKTVPSTFWKVQFSITAREEESAPAKSTTIHQTGES
jgi:DNA/RNA endonuclease G (NUC1)